MSTSPQPGINEPATPGITVCACGKLTTLGSRTCHQCRTEKERTRKSKYPKTPEQRRRNLARSYLSMYLKRGKTVKQLCHVCGQKAHPYHLDYAKPLEVVWACHKHRPVKPADLI